MLLARVEVDANTSSVAARINDLDAVDGRDPIIALPARGTGCCDVRGGKGA